MNNSFQKRLDKASRGADEMRDGRPANAADRAWAEGELEKMMRDEGLSRAQALALLKTEAPALYGIVALGVLPPMMTEGEKRQWAEGELTRIMESEGLTYDAAVASVRQYAPTIAGWLGVA
jgi:hypothetical protein